MTPGKVYECKDCSRTFRVYEDEEREPKCPSCESVNTAPREAKPLPSWLLSRLTSEPGCK